MEIEKGEGFSERMRSVRHPTVLHRERVRNVRYPAVLHRFFVCFATTSSLSRRQSAHDCGPGPSSLFAAWWSVLEMLWPAFHAVLVVPSLALCAVR